MWIVLVGLNEVKGCGEKGVLWAEESTRIQHKFPF
jgi:hypothetical protein